MHYFPAILSDPQLGISKKDKNQILGAASSAWFKKKSNLAVYTLAIIIWVAAMTSTRLLLKQAGLSSVLYNAIIWAVLFPLLLVGCHYLIFHVRFRPHLYQALREAGHDICPKCGYILIDIPHSTNKCPECGSDRAPLPTPQAPDQAPDQNE